MNESCQIQQGMMPPIGMQPTGVHLLGIYPGQLPGQMPMGTTMHGSGWFTEFEKLADFGADSATPASLGHPLSGFD